MAKDRGHLYKVDKAATRNVNFGYKNLLAIKIYDVTNVPK